MQNNRKYEDLQQRIDSYFVYCDSFNENDKCEIIKPYTLSGLLSHIGITKKEFDRLLTVKKYEKMLWSAKAKIEAFIEENALTGELSCNASLNSLKYYFGWGEKSEKGEESCTKHITVTLSDEMREIAR